MSNKVKFIDLGLNDYKEAWDLQEKLFKESIDLKIKNRFMSCQEKCFIILNN